MEMGFHVFDENQLSIEKKLKEANVNPKMIFYDEKTQSERDLKMAEPKMSF